MTGMYLSDRDLRAMLRLTRRYDEVEADEVLPAELCQDLVDLVRCDALSVIGLDSVRRSAFGSREFGETGELVAPEDNLFWHHYYDCLPCSYPGRTGDIVSVTKVSDFFSPRQWRNSGMYVDAAVGDRFEHEMMVCLPEGPAPTRLMRVLFFREDGSDFTERDRAVLTLLRPHLHAAYEVAKQSRRVPVPLTTRQWEILGYVAAGHSNYQIARRLHVAEATVRKHLENTFARLGVNSRVAALARVGPELSARSPGQAIDLPALRHS